MHERDATAMASRSFFIPEWDFPVCDWKNAFFTFYFLYLRSQSVTDELSKRICFVLG